MTDKTEAAMQSLLNKALEAGQDARDEGLEEAGDSLCNKSIRLLQKQIDQHTDPQDPYIYLTLDEAGGIVRALSRSRRKGGK